MESIETVSIEISNLLVVKTYEAGTRTVNTDYAATAKVTDGDWVFPGVERRVWITEDVYTKGEHTTVVQVNQELHPYGGFMMYSAMGTRILHNYNMMPGQENYIKE